MKQQTKGFSVIELLIAMAVLGILLTIGGINLGKSIREQRIREAATVLSESLTQITNQAQRESRFLRLAVSGNTISLISDSDDSVFRSKQLPYNAQVVSDTEVRVTGRGLPVTGASFTLAIGTKSKTVNLLPTGVVIIR